MKKEAEGAGATAERTAQAALIRDVFGDTFRTAALVPAWPTPAVTGLAAAAYRDRSLPSGELDPGLLARLADALEAAGCDSEDVLAHLRGTGPHVLGCWAVDGVLGRR